MRLVLDTVSSLLANIWNRIYTPPIEVVVYDVKDNVSTTPSHYETNYIPGKMELVPRMVTRTVRIGTQSYNVTETQYVPRLSDGKFQSRYVPESSMYIITADCISYMAKENKMLLICTCRSRCEEIKLYLIKNKCVRVRFLFGAPVISELKYNMWFESPPHLFVTLCIPALALAIIARTIITINLT